MTSLKILQNRFQKNILNNNSDIEKSILSSKNLSASEQMQIYQNSYSERIILAMMQDFPTLCDSIGESAFRSLVIDYLKEFPSTNFNLRYVGKNLGKFILQKDKSFIKFANLAKQEYAEIIQSQ
ncbi:MAG TPA: DNA-binding domain-containing protein [Coxiellaceae bacterium]|nr:MAG: hypothetical protein A3E81_06365 [Gammaproteobacteria bacterium RIFCSPHIGHO2_12_FULL_36_30]HLB56832.1 DNA-binding domain-containing protein [Coxiellaceae bacterium]